MVRLALDFSLIPSLSIKEACVDAETFAFQVLEAAANLFCAFESPLVV